MCPHVSIYQNNFPSLFLFSCLIMCLPARGRDNLSLNIAALKTGYNSINSWLNKECLPYFFNFKKAICSKRHWWPESLSQLRFHDYFKTKDWIFKKPKKILFELLGHRRGKALLRLKTVVTQKRSNNLDMGKRSNSVIFSFIQHWSFLKRSNLDHLNKTLQKRYLRKWNPAPVKEQQTKWAGYFSF